MWRRIFYGLVSIGVVITIVVRFDQVKQLFGVLAEGRWPYLLVALGAEAICQIARVISFSQIFTAIGVRANFKKILPQLLVSSTLDALIPTVGVGGATNLALEVADGPKEKIKVIIASLLAQYIDILIFCLVLGVGLGLLGLTHRLTLPIILASFLLACLTGLALIYIALVAYVPHGARILLKIVEKIQSFVVSLVARGYKAGWSNGLVDLSREMLRQLHLSFGRVLLSGLASLLFHATSLAVLWLSFLSFGINPGPIVVFSGYVIATLFSIISITPQGAGVVEGALSLYLIAVGVESPTAVVAALTYRLFVFWIPLLTGGLISLYRQVSPSTSSSDSV